jgi:hypothetical protein
MAGPPESPKQEPLQCVKMAEARIEEIEGIMRAEGFRIPRWRSREEFDRYSQLSATGEIVLTPRGEERRRQWKERHA